MSYSPPAHMAIVGCGFTGTSALVQLLDRSGVRRITVFESSGRPGPGFAYQPTECADYLINNTTDTMCLVPGNRQAFMQWLRGRGETFEPQGHLPRAAFGAFLEDAVSSARTMAAIKGIEIQTIAAEVTALHEPVEGGVVLLSWDGGQLMADAAILATGRCPERHDISLPVEGSSARYLGTHIGSTLLDELPLDATCHVLGASLSAYDVVNRLFSPSTGCRFERQADGSLRYVAGPNMRSVVLCSRSGRLKKMQSRRPMTLRRSRLVIGALQQAAEQGALSLETVVSLIVQEAQLHGKPLDMAALLQPYAGCRDADAVNARAGAMLAEDIAAAQDGSNFLVDLAQDAQILLWDSFAARLLPPAEEARYRRQAESALLCFSAPCPIPTAERLLALHRAGHLVVRHGVRSVHTGATFDIECAFGVESAGVLINTTGAVDRRVSSGGQGALIRAMHHQGLLRPYMLDGVPSDGAAVDMASFRVAGSRNIYLANMLLWGPGFFTSSAFMMARVVQGLLDGLYPTTAQR